MTAVDRLGRALAAAADPGVRYRVGTVVDLVDATHVTVDLLDRVVIATVPVSVPVAPGSGVRVSYLQNTYVVSAVLSGPAAGSYWSGRPASAYTLTASNYRSAAFSTEVDYTGDGAPDFAPVFDGDRFSLPFAGHYRFTVQGQFANASGGNRWLILYKNPSVNTNNSASNVSGGETLKTAKGSDSTDFTTLELTRPIWVATTDTFMILFRSTVGTSVENSAHQSLLTLELLRTRR